MTHGGVTASGVFTFNREGEAVSFVAQRYGEFNGQYLLKTWVVNLRDHKEFNGIRIPAAGEVIWKPAFLFLLLPGRNRQSLKGLSRGTFRRIPRTPRSPLIGSRPARL